MVFELCVTLLLFVVNYEWLSKILRVGEDKSLACIMIILYVGAVAVLVFGSILKKKKSLLEAGDDVDKLKELSDRSRDSMKNLIKKWSKLSVVSVAVVMLYLAANIYFDCSAENQWFSVISESAKQDSYMDKVAGSIGSICAYDLPVNRCKAYEALEVANYNFKLDSENHKQILLPSYYGNNEFIRTLSGINYLYTSLDDFEPSDSYYAVLEDSIKTEEKYATKLLKSEILLEIAVSLLFEVLIYVFCIVGSLCAVVYMLFDATDLAASIKIGELVGEAVSNVVEEIKKADAPDNSFYEDIDEEDRKEKENDAIVVKDDIYVGEPVKEDDEEM